MEIPAKGGQAKPEYGNATSFNWWVFTEVEFGGLTVFSERV
jgi:hypothetical protein